MNNILLTGTSKSTGSQAKDAMQVSENNSFLTEFNQASQMSSSQSTKPVNANKQSEPAVTSPIDVDLSEPLEGADIELIFAQLDMAQSFDKSKGGGQILPIFEVQGDVDSADNSHFDAITEALSNIDSADGDINILTHQLSSNSDSDINDDTGSLANNLFSDMIHLPVEGESNGAFLTSLSDSEKELLSNFSALSEDQLVALSHGDLVNLVNDFNLQAPVFDEPILDSTDNNLEVTLDPSIKEAPVITVAAPITASHITGFNTINNVSKDGGDTIQLANDSSSQKNSYLFASSNAQSKENVLGEKSASEAASMTQADSKVQPSAESLKTNTVAASMSLDSELAKSSRVEVLIASDETIDVKAIQNQSSFTPVHKSEVPQFQLSLRQQGESHIQMQEMIQRFSPVMKQQLITMVSNGIQQAEIRLDPPELGHLTVKIQINGDQTQVQFHVAQSQTRDLLEQAIPRLRDMLAQEGLQLTDSHVSQGGGGRDGQPQDSSSSYAEQQDVDENSAIEHSMFQNHSESLQSGIDYYA